MPLRVLYCLSYIECKHKKQFRSDVVVYTRIHYPIQSQFGLYPGEEKTWKHYCHIWCRLP